MDGGSAIRNSLPTHDNKPPLNTAHTTRSKPTQPNTHEQCIIAVRDQMPPLNVCVINTVVYVTKSVGWAENVACTGEKWHGYWILVGEINLRPFGRNKRR
jgi:hypothetical protein